MDLLKDVVIYNEDNSYTEYSGQAVIFMLTMADGTQIEIVAYNPFLIIDGVGYKTKYEPCEALNHYANMLLEPKFQWKMTSPTSEVDLDTSMEQTIQ